MMTLAAMSNQSTILLVVLLVLLVFGLPNFGITQNYAPAGALGFLLVVVIVLMLLGVI